MNKILITGGSGFIGTNVLEHFQNEHYVLNIDKIEPKSKEWTKYWRQVDILDYSALSNAIHSFNPDYIIHLAARTDLEGKSFDDYSANTLGVKNVLSVANELPKLKKILITSSMLVCRSGYIPNNQFDYCPSTMYGASKVQTERIVWENKPSCDWAILRPTSIWGSWFGEPYRNFFDIVKSGLYFHIGHKSCKKTYGYVENAVYQIERILMSDTTNENNKVFYLGDQPAINIEEWANQIANELGKKIPRAPYFLIKCAGILGDILEHFGIHFPMTSFRLNNMTTDNIIDLRNTYSIAPNPPVDRITGIRRTLDWMRNH